VSPILWSNKQQPTISLFSTEVEYRSFAKCNKRNDLVPNPTFGGASSGQQANDYNI
jgi:hypothetical protein